MHIALQAPMVTTDQINVALIYLAGLMGIVIVVSLAVLALKPLLDFSKRKLEISPAFKGPILLVAFIWLLLFGVLTLGLFWIILSGIYQLTLINGGQGNDISRYIWTTAALTATLAAIVALPFTIIRISLNARQTKNAEEGLTTERITKAVEGLGSEKTVSIHLKDSRGRLLYHEKEAAQQGERPELDYKRPVIVQLSEPNIEVRIGAIYALERIAQDSDRDHVQIMEILCAYIRENAPGKDAEPWPEIEMRLGEDDGPLEDDWDDRVKTFEEKHKAALKKVEVREDIQTALKVIGRRSAHQRGLEAKNNDPDSKEVFVFDLPPPDPDEFFEPETGTPIDGKGYNRALEKWQAKLERYSGYRLDLRGANLRGSDLEGYHLAGARLEGARMQGARLAVAQMQGAVLNRAHMQGARLEGARMQGAVLNRAQMQVVELLWARMQGAQLTKARMQGASLIGAQLQGSLLNFAEMQDAYLIGAQMQATSLYWANMKGSWLHRAKMQGARLELAHMEEAQLHGAQLQMADMRGVRMQGARLYPSQVVPTRLFEVLLHRARLSKEQLIDLMSITDTCFVGARVRNSNEETIAELKPFWTEVFGDATALPPDAEDRPRHWPEFILKTYTDEDGQILDRFDEEWREWRLKREKYKPPETPDPERGVHPPE